MNNSTFDQYWVIGKRPSEEFPEFIERYPIGDPLILITSDMPVDLKEEIFRTIERYCGH